MPRYLIQAASHRQDLFAAPDSLPSWVRRVLEDLGGRLESLDFTIGEEDLVLIAQMPDEASMAAFSELASSAGKLRVARVASLIRPEQTRIALSRGHGVLEPDAPPVVDSSEATSVSGSSAPSHRAVPEEAALGDADPVHDDGVPSLENAAPAASMAVHVGDVPPGACALLAGRFTRFSELAAFSETIQALPGIQGVTIQQFLRGMVSMRIQYDSPIPFMTRLVELRQFKPEVREIAPGQYEMLIFAETRGVPGSRVDMPERPPAAEPSVPAPSLGSGDGWLRPALVRTAQPQDGTALAPQARGPRGLGGLAALLISSLR